MAVGDALYLVSLCVDPEHEVEFDRFYNREHIPSVMDVCPEIRTARRYKQTGVDGSLRWYDRQFLAIFELDKSADISRIAAAGVLPQDHPAAEAWEEWRSRHLRNVRTMACRSIFEHPRATWDGAFGSRPFFMVTADIAETNEADFAHWYHGEYLPQNVAEVPTWAAVRRYENVNSDSRRTFVIYEAWDAAGLEHSLATMRGAVRTGENLDWHRWDEVITYQDAATFEPVYRYPG